MLSVGDISSCRTVTAQAIGSFIAFAGYSITTAPEIQEEICVCGQPQWDTLFSFKKWKGRVIHGI